ncbi:LexA family protein [Facklamia languida]
MSIEDKLRELINNRYGSVRQFSIQVDLPYTTILSILDRGVLNAKALNVFKVCEELSIDAEALGNGQIVSINSNADISVIYSQLQPPRQRKVYNFAEHQLDEQNGIEEETEIYLYGQTAAGAPISYGDTSYETISANVPKGADGALLVRGDSMQPLIENSSIIFYKKQPVVENGEIAIVELNGSEVTCKKFYFDGEKAILRSINDKYEDIVVDGDIRIVGKVII